MKGHSTGSVARPRCRVVITGVIGVVLVAAMLTAVAGRADAATPGGAYTALTPARLLDTRSGVGALGAVGPGKTLTVAVSGHGGIPSSGVGAVVLNVAVTQPKAAGFLTVYRPDGLARPGTSNLNFSPGETIANVVVIPTGDDGTVDFYNGSAGAVQVIADVSGWFAPAPSEPGGFIPFDTYRVMDTRTRQGATGPVGPGKTVTLALPEFAGEPWSDVGPVVLNVTVTQPKTAGFLTIFPHGGARPGTSNLNFSAGETIPNLVVTRTGSNGTVDFYNGSAGTVQVIADALGYFVPGEPGPDGLMPLTPARLLDTRTSMGAPGPVGPGQTVTLAVPGHGGVPASGGGSVVLNVTVTQPKTAGFLSVYPHGSSRPGTSNLNFSPGETIPNLVVTPMSADGKVDFYNGSAGTVQVIADVSAWIVSSTGTLVWGSPHDIGSVEGNPNSVSCATATFCVAVDSGGNAITYNGNSWSSPTPVDPNGGGLTSISCPSATFCVAVDMLGEALTYNGRVWSPPSRIDPNIVELLSVSCPTTTFCVAVDGALAFTYNSGTWSFAVVATSAFDLTAVSCATVTFCVATTDSGGTVVYDGVMWKVADLDAYEPLTAVSCPTSTFCAAVGGQVNSIGVEVTYNGTAWSAPTFVRPDYPLASVSCASPAFCAAVGAGAVVTYENGGWSGPAEIPDAAGLDSVTCPTAALCVAVDEMSGSAIFGD